MQDITNQNFKELYPCLERTLRNACFLTIDTELTGITANDIKPSLFDSIQERYAKQRDNVQNYIIIQFGITAFQRVQNEENTYTAEIFNFYLLPRSIPTTNRRFLWQTSALEFLATHGFDFNKVAYHGISYVDESDRKNLQQILQKGLLLSNLRQYLTFKEIEDLNDYSNQIKEWLDTASDEISSFKVDTSTPILQYFMHKELRSRFSNVWTLSGNNMITAIKVTPDVRTVLEKEEGSILEDALLESYIGFSKVFDLLVTLKKPIIAHNALLDLMFIYQQFYKPLPQKYVDFKNSLHKLFPIIYDTKFLSYELREYQGTDEKWKLNSLEKLFHYFTKEHGKHLIIGSPIVKIISEADSNKLDDRDMIHHNAGWDSYFTGYIFIKIAHIFAGKQYGHGLTMRDFTNTELMHAVQTYANCITISRGRTSHLNLDGSEPESRRPQWLYVKAISTVQITDKMSQFGCIDVKPLAPKRALIAVATHGSAREILQHFKQSKELYVVPYSPIRHSPSIQFILWGSIATVVSGGIVAWMFQQRFQKSS